MLVKKKAASESKTDKISPLNLFFFLSDKKTLRM